MIWMRSALSVAAHVRVLMERGDMTEKPVEEMSFEEAMTELEQVVGQLESRRRGARGVDRALRARRGAEGALRGAS